MELPQTGQTTKYGPVAQLVAHLHGMQGVRGSSPLRSTHRESLRFGGGFRRFAVSTSMGVIVAGCGRFDGSGATPTREAELVPSARRGVIRPTTDAPTLRWGRPREGDQRDETGTRVREVCASRMTSSSSSQFGALLRRAKM